METQYAVPQVLQKAGVTELVLPKTQVLTLAKKNPTFKEGHYIQLNKADPYALFILSGTTSMFKEHGFICDLIDAKTLPIGVWYGHQPSATTFIIRTKIGGELKTLKAFLKENLGINKNLYQIVAGLNFRRTNLTTSQVNSLVGNGTIGFYKKHKDQKGYKVQKRKTRKSIHIAYEKSEETAQQMYNASIMNDKIQDPKNLELFGRLFKSDGTLNKMFPRTFYNTQGKLKRPYAQVMEKHGHLLAPVTEPALRKKIIEKYGTLNVTK